MSNAQIKEPKSCTCLIFHVILYSEKSNFLGMIGVVCSLKAVIEVKLPNVLPNLVGHYYHGVEFEAGHWTVVFEGVFVKCRSFCIND